MTKQIFSAIPQALMMFGVGLGLRHEKLLSHSGLQTEDLNGPDNLVDYDSVIKIWSLLLKQFPSLPLGLLFSNSLNTRQLGIVGNVLLHSENAGAAIERLVRLQQLLDPFIKVDVIIDDDLLTIKLQHEQQVYQLKEPMEGMLGLMIAFVNINVSQSVAPARVQLRHGQTHSSTVYEEHWQCIPDFLQSEYSVCFPVSILNKTIKGADVQVGNYIFDYARQLKSLQSSDSNNDLIQSIEQMLMETFINGMDLSQERLAAQLHMSARTLQRRLQAQNTSYQLLLERVQKKLALFYIEQNKLSLFEIAFMLGYSEQSSFNRAFKKWTGHSPTEYRQNVLKLKKAVK